MKQVVAIGFSSLFLIVLSGTCILVSYRLVLRGEPRVITVPLILLGILAPPMLWAVVVFRLSQRLLFARRLFCLVLAAVVLVLLLHIHAVLVGISLELAHEYSKWWIYSGVAFWLYSPAIVLLWYPFLLRADRSAHRCIGK